MVSNFRSSESYYGNTAEARKRQRANLIPGGNMFQKRKISEARLNCWWEYNDLETKQFIYEGYENKRDLKDAPKEELKNEEYLDNWWGKIGTLDLEDKKYIYKNIMSGLTKKSRSDIFKGMEECLKKKLKKGI